MFSSPLGKVFLVMTLEAAKTCQPQAPYCSRITIHSATHSNTTNHYIIKICNKYIIYSI